jgi:hypothetical protein
MSDAMFHYIDRRASEIERIARSLEPEILLLSSLDRFKLKPEAAIREASARLMSVVKELDALADRFPQPRVMEAAE